MRYVALLRGINVGGNTMIKMSELKATFERLGFANVATYINSGNLAFDVRKSSDATLAAKIEKAVEKDFGKPVKVMVRPQEEIVRILANNPFDGEYKSHKEMHVLFLNAALPNEKAKELRAIAPEGERFAVSGREIYCHLPMGVAESVMGRGLFERKIKVDSTARNWRTVEKLAEL
ncbi:MAG TPA: DUF1697 domain-containing protein [Pyrinomonadaceae bacterium]|nr:DUF1697 domain-containing protein [Pyrinomonadaceae bacterium]